MLKNTWRIWCASLVWMLSAWAHGAAAAAAENAIDEPTSWSAQWIDWIRAGQHSRMEADFDRRLQQASSDIAVNARLNNALNAMARRWRVEPAVFESWLRASEHGAARLAQAQSKLQMAWAARGTKWAREVHAENFARMHTLMLQAEPLYAEALKGLGPLCDACHEGLVVTAYHNRGASEAAIATDRAMQAMGRGAYQTPLTYLQYLQPKWGGSWPQAEAFVQVFSRDYPGSDTTAVLRSHLAEYKANQLWSARKYQQAMVLLQESLTWDPANARAWADLAAVSNSQGDHAMALEAATRALKLDPEAKLALSTRASVLLKGPNPGEALADLEGATVLGDDWALASLVRILANGLHGTTKAPERVATICRAAMERDTPTAYACMASVYYFGLGESVNKPRALGYFLEASDRGFKGSAVDAGFMLMRGDGVPRDEEQAIVQWIRAADAGDEKATRLLVGHLDTWTYFWRVLRPGYLREAKAYAEQVQAVPGVLLAGLLGWLLS
ncbi:hypothetical protein [Hydrogenophaga sp.]|uniref:hypothetical protein n=1 Tax=Hydrogenophaga sp. TaxID=1904254 RepID=UPI002AB9D1CA|nr:hypothetical protein [Hydrogenophaga sp.]MDZ4398072.1 hypothetical protein [Hydrogenophaga sp.]